MDKQFLTNNFGWGFILWLFGYLLSFVLFFIVPPSFIGWVIMPLGIAITLWILLKKVVVQQFSQYLTIAVIWILIAVFLDYLFIVKLLNPADGYYKPSVYIYYILTFVLPILIGWITLKKRDN